MSVSRARQAAIKARARYFAAGVIENIEAILSGQFDDMDLTEKEIEIVDNEMKAISRRISPSAGGDHG